MVNTRFRLKPGAIPQLLKGEPMRAAVDRVARQIAAEAGPGMEASSRIGTNRARASVITATDEARRAEARDRRLSSALASARV